MRSTIPITGAILFLSLITLASSTFFRLPPSYNLHTQSLRIKLPDAEFTGVDLIYWNHVSRWEYIRYISGGGYKMNISNASFFENSETGNCPEGTISLDFDVFGNASGFSNGTSAWASNMTAEIKIDGLKVTQIQLSRMPEVQVADVEKFLNDWAVFSVLPTLNALDRYSNCTSSSTASLDFPSMNFTGYDLESWTGRRYMNYTWTGFSVYVYNFVPSLSRSGRDVYGSISLNFNVFGNDSSYPCYNGNCRKTYEYSNATIYVSSIYSSPFFEVNRSLAVNASDVENFLREYYNAVMLPNIVDYYGLNTTATVNQASNSSNTTNKTVYFLSDDDMIQI